MREAANILDLIRDKRRLSERDRAFLEAMADGLDILADNCSLDGLVDMGLHLQQAVDAYNTTREG